MRGKRGPRVHFSQPIDPLDQSSSPLNAAESSSSDSTSTLTEVLDEDDSPSLDEQPQNETRGPQTTVIVTELEKPGSDPVTSAFTSDQSVFKATPEEHGHALRSAAGGGRPPNSGHPPASMNKISTTIFPNPRFRYFKNDATAKDQKTKSFYNWWNALPQWAKDRSVAYVYRDQPVLLPVVDEDGKKFDYKYIDKISGNEPLQDDMDLLHRYGCGSYQIMFNETESNRTVCQVWVVNIGGAQYHVNPPADRRISDVKQIDLTHPANASYVAFLRGKGQLPEQQDARQGEEMAAQTEMAREMTGLVKDLIKERSVPKDRDNSDVVDGMMKTMLEGAQASNKLVTETAKEQLGMFRETVDQIKQIQEASGGGNKGQDVESLFRLALDLADKMGAGKNGASEEVRELRAEISRLQNERIESLNASMRRLEDRISNPTPSAGPFATLKEGVSAIKEFVSVADEIRGTGKEANPVEDVVDDLAGAGGPKWLRYLPHVATIATVAKDIFLSTRQQPQMMPQPQVQVNQFPSTQFPSTHPPGAGMPQGPQLVPRPMALPMPQPQAQPQPQAHGLPPDVTALLDAIRIPLINYISEQYSGEDFADWFVGGFGLARFRDIVLFGEDALLTSLYSYPPVAQNLAVFSQERVKEFVREFVSFKVDQAGKGDEEPEEKVSTVTGDGAT